MDSNIYQKIEELAQALHEAGREAVERGNTVCAADLGIGLKQFIEWHELTDNAKEGRRQQAAWLLKRYDISPKPNFRQVGQVQ